MAKTRDRARKEPKKLKKKEKLEKARKAVEEHHVDKEKEV